jgi:mRNA interferase RelE/StbE
MAYTIAYKPTALKGLRGMPKSVAIKIKNTIMALAKEPYPQGSKKLKGAIDLWRIRQGNYRIIYTVKDNELTILVLKIGHRKDIYE